MDHSPTHTHCALTFLDQQTIQPPNSSLTHLPALDIISALYNAEAVEDMLLLEQWDVRISPTHVTSGMYVRHANCHIGRGIGHKHGMTPHTEDDDARPRMVLLEPSPLP